MGELVSNASQTMLQTGGGGMFMPKSLGEVIEGAKLMAQAGPAVPKHCQGAPGVCFAIIMRALRWEMDPFAVASESYVVNGVVAYGAKVIHAAIQMHGGLIGDIEVEYLGEGPDERCKVTGTFVQGGQKVKREYVSPAFKDIKVKNSPLWTSDRQQQLHYFSSRSWARRWRPAIVMGAFTPDEIKAGEDVTDADRAEAIEHETKVDVLDDNAMVDPNAPAPTAPLGHRYSYSLEKCTTEPEITAEQMKYQPEIEAVAQAERKPLRELMKAHLRRVRGETPVDEVMEFSRAFREQKEEAA